MTLVNNPLPMPLVPVIVPSEPLLYSPALSLAVITTLAPILYINLSSTSPSAFVTSPLYSASDTKSSLLIFSSSSSFFFRAVSFFPHTHIPSFSSLDVFSEKYRIHVLSPVLHLSSALQKSLSWSYVKI